MTSHLPAPMEIRQQLAELLDREITATPGPPLAPTPNNPCTIGVYVDDRLETTSLVSFDLPLSAYAGAAIGLMPVGVAEDAVNEGTLDDTLRDNVYEVLNIAAALFNVEGASHVRLHDVTHAGAPVPQHVLARALTLGRREDLALDIKGYGAGRLSVVMV